MEKYNFFRGTITMITDFPIKENDKEIGCYKLMSVEDSPGSMVNFVVSPSTYFVDHVTVHPGDKVVGFYDVNAPVPLIFPPQLRAIVMASDMPGRNVKVDFFNSQLISSDNTLKLNLSPYTRILLENDQIFAGLPANRNLVIVYGASTMSIPAQTTPYEIIVLCERYPFGG